MQRRQLCVLFRFYIRHPLCLHCNSSLFSLICLGLIRLLICCRRTTTTTTTRCLLLFERSLSRDSDGASVAPPPTPSSHFPSSGDELLCVEGGHLENEDPVLRVIARRPRGRSSASLERRLHLAERNLTQSSGCHGNARP